MLFDGIDAANGRRSEPVAGVFFAANSISINRYVIGMSDALGPGALRTPDEESGTGRAASPGFKFLRRPAPSSNTDELASASRQQT